ncbi:MAG: hypothetical protein WC052_05375 [Patescibacteria group bacterium]
MEPDIKALLEENLRLTREVHVMMKRTRRYMATRTVLTLISFALIVGPLLFAAFYLPPLIGPYIEQYQQLMNNLEQLPAVPTPSKSKVDIEQLLDQARQFGIIK